MNDHGFRALTTSVRRRSASVQQQLAALPERRDAVKPIDVTLRLVERDREAFGSVLGSAVAFRLFLFFVPVLLLLVGLLQFELAGISADDVAKQAGVGSALASEIEQGVQRSGDGRWIVVVIGAAGALWAGRSLAKVLSASAILAWRVDPPRRSVSLRVTGAIVGLMMTILVAAGVVNRIQLAAGPAIGGTSLIAVAVVYGIAWFLVSTLLPRATTDPSALIPGAVLAGVVMAAVQAFTQLYLPDKISHASDLFGGFGVAVVTLGSFFLVGRVLVATSLVNAVVWERFGSVAGFVLGLPGVRRLARRMPFVVRFFDLDPTTLAPRTQKRAESPPEGVR
jgi:uncharacterized BrkB/YihY/UPF0761 family membrane protein